MPRGHGCDLCTLSFLILCFVLLQMCHRFSFSIEVGGAWKGTVVYKKTCRGGQEAEFTPYARIGTRL